MIRSSIFNIIFYVFTFFAAMGCWIAAHLSGRRALWAVARFWGRTTLVLLRVILGAKVEIRGLAHLDLSRSQLVASKHQSELDIVLLAALMRDISAVAMEELTRLPFFKKILSTIGTVNIAVDSGPQGRTQQMIEGAKRIRAENRTMVIYPEGELMKLGAKERYKNGVGHLYQAMEVEAVPVAVSLGAIWPQRQWRKVPGARGVIEFMEPIPPGLEFAEFMQLLESRIETRTMELIEECATGRDLEEARRRYAAGADNFS